MGLFTLCWRASYSGIAESTPSQTAYGLREYVEVDEELWSDAECNRRATALLAYLKDPTEHLHKLAQSETTRHHPIIAADKVHAELPTEGVNSDFRVESVEYQVPKEAPTKLEITLELGKEPPHLANYLYGLRTHTPNVEKLSRTKLGKKGASQDAAKYVLEAQGAGLYPMYVNPNGRYVPAVHNHSNLYPAGAGIPGHLATPQLAGYRWR